MVLDPCDFALNEERRAFLDVGTREIVEFKFFFKSIIRRFDISIIYISCSQTVSGKRFIFKCEKTFYKDVKFFMICIIGVKSTTLS